MSLVVPPPPASALAIPVGRWADAVPGAFRTRRTRRRLLHAAGTLFDTHGYRGASLRDILEAADLTKGALYFHFSSKHALAVGLLDEVQESWAQVRSEIEERGLDPLWRLLVETDAHVGRWMHDVLVRGVGRAVVDPDLIELRMRWVRTWEAGVAAHLHAARDAGLVRADVDVTHAGRQLAAMIAGHAHLAVPDDPLWERITDTWRTVLPRGASPVWLEGWATSEWAQRPPPRPEDYRQAREP